MRMRDHTRVVRNEIFERQGRLLHIKLYSEEIPVSHPNKPWELDRIRVSRVFFIRFGTRNRSVSFSILAICGYKDA